MTVSGLCVGLGAVSSTGENAMLARYFFEMFVKIPAVWAFGGIALFLFGLFPRWMGGASYGIWVLFILVEILWEQQTVSDALYAISPFSWVNPMRMLQPGGLMMLTGVAALLGFSGVWLFQKRDAALK